MESNKLDKYQDFTRELKIEADWDTNYSLNPWTNA